MKKKLAVFVSGRGSNLLAVLNAGYLNGLAEILVVISDKKDCPAFKIAQDFNIRTISTGNLEGQISFNEVLQILKELEIDLVILAGFLKLIPPELISYFENRIINIHPALLPAFGGPGMYGMNVHKAVYNSSAKVSGPTVHFVDTSYDTGKIIAQSAVDISSVSSPEEIAALVLKAEHKLLPEVIFKLVQDKVKIINNRVEVLL